MAGRFDGQAIRSGRQGRKVELAIGSSRGFRMRGAAGEPNLGGSDGSAAGVAQDTLPGGRRWRLLRTRCG